MHGCCWDLGPILLYFVLKTAVLLSIEDKSRKTAFTFMVLDSIIWEEKRTIIHSVICCYLFLLGFLLHKKKTHLYNQYREKPT